jgi:hypothetical protein
MSAPVRLARDASGVLHWQGDSGPVAVRPRRCFPWAHPREWMSLRDEDGTERALIRSPLELEPESRALLEEELNDNGQTFVILRILECRKEIELRCWRVETLQGPRIFQTELDEWPLRLPGGAVLIRDLAGDLYTVPDPGALDAESRKRLWVLLD